MHPGLLAGRYQFVQSGMPLMPSFLFVVEDIAEEYPPVPARLAVRDPPGVQQAYQRWPAQKQYEALRLPSDLPILRTLRVVYSDGDRPVEVTVMARAGHLYELQYEFV
ncbi:hypothetical protein ABH925_004017 [Streptacidiphilus sp. EB129]